MTCESVTGEGLSVILARIDERHWGLESQAAQLNGLVSELVNSTRELRGEIHERFVQMDVRFAKLERQLNSLEQRMAVRLDQLEQAGLRFEARIRSAIGDAKAT